ncbi:lipoate--protein ligase family protein [Paraburkholderia lycopersici]|uniref:Lipoate-protein ligase A n=1 Tax=Paraburkholderia lycopersici TaxID=416944 RepID=A0A1G7B2R9_9BURK|nr:lipoate--protein ligase family protein [Paraburkholderia lycopersici]SDE21408.1 Lipoate-protein ligase A [Paraburkholderia lycopersici]
MNASATNSEAPWRLVVGDHSYADFSISVSPAVERAVAEKLAPPTVYLNVFDEDSITVGVNEDPNQVLDLPFCRSNNVLARRRVSGGGAIYAGRGSAFLAFYLPTGLRGVPGTAAQAFPTILGHVAGALHEVFGLRVAYRPLNDVEIDGRKLVATSLKIEGGVLTFRILLNVKAIDTAIAARAMPMAPEKVKDKKHKDLGSRYTYLEQELGREVRAGELAAWVRACVRRAFGDVALEPGALGSDERVFAQQAESELHGESWFHEKSEATRYDPIAQAGDRVVRGREKAPAGLIWLSLLVRGGTVVKAIVNGDWHPRPLASVAWLEDGFAGLAATREACSAHIEAFLARPDVEFAGVEPVHLVTALDKALAELANAGVSA